MKVVVLCPHPRDRAPSQRLKFEQYYQSWVEAGYELDVRPFWSERAWENLYQPGRWLRKIAATAAGFLRRTADFRAAVRADVVFLHLEATPLGPPLIERALARRGVPMVYDIDDLIYLSHSSRSNTFMRWLRNGDKVAEVAALADHVIVCTEHLRTFALEHSAHVTNISSTIDLYAYRPRPHRTNTAGVVVGWSGSHSTSPYLHLLDDVLRKLQQSDGIRIKVIGDAAFSIKGVDIDAQDWALATEVADLSEIDIGVYPLPDEEWVLGKSGLKALQYMALEIPTVAQRIGTNLGIIVPDRNGFLASSPAQWEETLRTLVRNPELRRITGQEGRRTVEERYSVEVTAPCYLAVLEEVSAKRGPGGEGPRERPDGQRDEEN